MEEQLEPRLIRLADRLEVLTGKRPSREELLQFPTFPRAKCHCDACGDSGQWHAAPSEEELDQYQEEFLSELVNMNDPIRAGSGTLGRLGAFASERLQSLQQPPAHVQGPPSILRRVGDLTTLTYRPLPAPTAPPPPPPRKHKQNPLKALLRTTSPGETLCGLVQPAPQPAKGQGARPRKSKSAQDISDQATGATPHVSQPPRLQDLPQHSDDSLSIPREDDPVPPFHRALKTKVKTRPDAPIAPTLETREPPVEPPDSPAAPIVCMTLQSKQIFARMLATDPTNRKPVHFDDFTAAMIDAGFVVKRAGRGTGSAVKFRETRTKAGTISFHRPHPDPNIDHNKLRTWGGRLQKNFGWEVESLVERE